MIPPNTFEPKFVAEDLPYNRRGELSPRQKTEMASHSRGCLTRLLIFNGVALLLIVVTRAISIQTFDQFGVFGLGMLFLGLPWLIMALLPAPKSLYDVQAATGSAKVSMGYNRGQYKYYMLVVDGVDFRVSAELHSTLEKLPDAAVAVYYTPSGNRNILVSWEPM